MTVSLYTRHRTTGPTVGTAYENISVPSASDDFSIPVYVDTPPPLASWVSGGKYHYRVECTIRGTAALLASPYSFLAGHRYERISVGSSYGPNEKWVTTDMMMKELNLSLTSSVSNETVSMAYISTYKSATISDVLTDNYKKRINNGEIINNPVLNDTFHLKHNRRRAKQLQPSTTTVQLEHKTGFYPNDYFLTGSTTPGDPLIRPLNEDELLGIIAQHQGVEFDSPTDIKQLAINKAFGRVNSGSYEYLVELGEGRETVAYISTVFRRMFSMFKAVKRGKLKGVLPKTYKRAKRRAKARSIRFGTSYERELDLAVIHFTAQAWMELRFAIRPLVYSVEDAISLYNEGLKKESGRTTEAVVQKGICQDLVETESTVDGILTKTSFSTFATRKAVGGVFVNIDATLASMRQLGFTDLGGTLWELTFLSWAADYFGNLDGLFYHLSPKIGVEVNGAWASTLDHIHCVSRITQYNAGNGKWLSETEISSVRQLYHRHPVTGPSNFVIDVDLDIYKLADLAALYLGLKR